MNADVLPATRLEEILLDPSGPKVVAIGGGHGLSITLEAIQAYASEITAVVAVADDGGSSGRLTSGLGIPPPGDIRRPAVGRRSCSPSPRPTGETLGTAGNRGKRPAGSP